MGATTFDHAVIGKFENAREAFKKAIEEAEYSYGHDGYTGSIAEKESFVLPDAPKFGTKKFEKFEMEKIEKADKWGPAYCVEITGRELKKLKEREGLKGKKGIRAFYFWGWASC